MSVDDAMTLVGVGFFVVLIGGIGCFGYTKRTAERGCLKQGYREVKMDWALDTYCITRRDQTDVVVPYDEAMRVRADQLK